MAANVGPTTRESERAAARQMWGSASSGWADNATYVDSRGRAVGDALLEAGRVSTGQRVLELACGPGGVGLAAAERVGSNGHVVLSDLAPEMIAIAARRASELGLTNVSVRELDLQEIDEPNASYEVVVCREGLMLVSEPPLALKEIRRVLGKGGRAAVAVWGSRDENPWLGVLFDAVTESIGFAVPPPGVPGPFSLQDPARLEALFVDEGFDEVAVIEVAEPLDVPSFDEWWRIVPPLAGPIAALVASLPPESVSAIRSHAEQSLDPYRCSTGLAIPGLALVGSGVRS
jgi:SAM-dependent methyltransferase